MKVLVTGHNGYIGSTLVPMLQQAGHEVTGLDSYLFEACTFGEVRTEPRALRLDIRDVEVDDLSGFEAILHLAGISNDPLGDLRPECTHEINHRATVRLARLAKQAGVPRFLFSSSCSNYGAAGEDWLDETARFSPVTPYAVSKVRAEQDLLKLADDRFSPVLLRSATAFGVSSHLRGDLVVNNLVGYAFSTGEVLIRSDGMPWRPLVHIEDISRAFLAALEAPREAVHAEAFNVGRTEENFRVRQVADMVEQTVPDCRVVYAPGASPDVRNYRVNCDKIRKRLPAFRPRRTVQDGIEELHTAFKTHGLTAEQFLSARFLRIKAILEAQSRGELDQDMRWLLPAKRA